MPSARIRRHVGAGARAGLVLGLLALAPASAAPARAESGPASSAAVEGRRPFPGREASARRGAGGPQATGSWWLGTAGIALALALCGGVSVASRRYLPARAGGPLRVIARASLSPRQAVYLVEVGQRVLIVGAGAQGPPSLLGELTDPAERERFAAAPAPGPASHADLAAGPGPGRPSSSGMRPSGPGRFDLRVGDDE